MGVPQIWINMDGLFHGKSENKIDDLGAALTHINTIIGTTLFSVLRLKFVDLVQGVAPF